MTDKTTLNRLTAFALDDAGLMPKSGLEDAIALAVELHTRPADANGFTVQDLDGSPLKGSDGGRIATLDALVKHLAQTRPALFQGTEPAPNLTMLPTANPFARATRNLTAGMILMRENPQEAARLKAEAEKTDAAPNLTQLHLAARAAEPGAAEALADYRTNRNR